MSKALGERVAVIEAELRHLWKHSTSTADSYTEMSTQMQSLGVKVDRLEKAMKVGLTLVAAIIVQNAGEPGAKALAHTLRTVLTALL